MLIHRVFEFTRTKNEMDSNDPKANDCVERDHLNSIIDLFLLYASVPLHLYDISNQPLPTETITSSPPTLRKITELFGLILIDCLQTIGSGLGMNPKTADGIYSQKDSVRNLLRSVRVLINTVSLHDVYTQGQEDKVPIMSSYTVEVILQRMLCCWPHASYSSTVNGSEHTISLNSFLLRVEGYPSKINGFPMSSTGDYRSVPVSSPNAVREEAFLSTAVELLNTCACAVTYESHEHENHNTSSASKLLPVTEKFSTYVNRILSKIISGVASPHFKVSLQCINSFYGKGMFLLRRYFLEPRLEEGLMEVRGSGEKWNFMGPSSHGSGCFRCVNLQDTRSERINCLVGTLRSVRGTHWNSSVRAASGELLDRLYDVM